MARADKREGMAITRATGVWWGLLRGSIFSPDDPRGAYIQINLWKLLHIRFAFRISVSGVIHNWSASWTLLESISNKRFDSQHYAKLSWWQCAKLIWAQDF